MSWTVRDARSGVALLGLLVGCQASTEPDVIVPRQASVQGASLAETRSGGLQAPVLGDAPGLTAPPAMVEQAVAVAANGDAAQRAFDVLTASGTTVDAWDAAQQELLELGTHSAPILAAALRSDSSIQRETAATTLVLLGPDAAELATTELLQALNDDSDFVRANAAAALMQVPGQAAKALPTLVHLLQASDAGLRQMAAMNLRSQPQAVEDYLPEVLTQLAREDSADVTVPLIELLGAMGPAASPGVPQLQPLANSGHPEISQAAASALQLVQGEIQQTQAESPSFQ